MSRKLNAREERKKTGLRLIHTAEFGAESGRRKNIEEQIFKNKGEKRKRKLYVKFHGIKIMQYW